MQYIQSGSALDSYILLFFNKKLSYNALLICVDSMTEPVQSSQVKTVIIQTLSQEGRGIAFVAGKTTFVTGGLPGEQVTLGFLKKRRHFNEAVAASYQGHAHQDRVEPGCKHFLMCGGCSLQHMDPQAQIALKHRHFVELWQSLLPSEPLFWAPPLQAASWGYRRKARLGVKYVNKKQKLLVGFREFDGRKILDMTSCAILEPAISKELPALQACLAATSIRAAIPQLEIASSEQQVAVIIRHLEPFGDDDLTLLNDFSQVSGWHIWLQPKGPDSVQPLNVQGQLLQYSLPEYGVCLAFHPADFVQINSHLNVKMIQQALEWLAITSGEVILDLFCGLGNFSIPIAKQGAYVWGVEGSEDMVIRASTNAASNQVSQYCQFASQNLEADEFDGAWTKVAFDKVLLDPPRTGAQACMTWLLKIKPKRIVYVSCHSATLVRDAQVLIAGGYQVTKAGVMDMFPHTQHVEAMACFDYVGGQ